MDSHECKRISGKIGNPKTREHGRDVAEGLDNRRNSSTIHYMAERIEQLWYTAQPI
jgi:hypothetical protein